MRILIAPDKFKGSLNARAVAENIALGIRDIIPDARIEIVPVADGGEGTAEVIHDSLGGEWVTCAAHDALGGKIEARYVSIRDRGTAVMEMSEAAGMRRLKDDVRDIMRASTFGVGEMLLDATNRNAHKIIVGLGGSATNDGGVGMARALGFRFLGENEDELTSVARLLGLKRIIAPSPQSSPSRRGWRVAPGEGSCRIIAAVDVKNPLLGENGATRIFGPQKGATPERIPILENALARLADTVARDFHCDFRNEPGAGAAGGLGFGLMSFCGASVLPGFEVVADAILLEEKIRSVDVVITGEGKLDSQTLEGKAPAGVAKLARKHQKRSYAIVGQIVGQRNWSDLFDGTYELAQPPITQTEAINQSAELLRARARELATTLKH
jgi:glycerate kinase